jgi:hypothetical protein
MAVSAANLAGGTAGDTVGVQGNIFTCVATVTDAATQFSNITELEALIEAITDISSSQNGTVVSMVAVTAGTAGNAYSITIGAFNAGTMSASGTLFTGGRNNATVTVAGHALTAGTDFTASVSNDSTATSLALAIDGLAEVSSGAVAAVVTVTAIAEGEIGNSITLARSEATSCTLSGATLTLGSDETDATVASIDTSAPAQVISCHGASKVEIKNFDGSYDCWVSLTATEPSCDEANGFEKITHGAGWRTYDAPPDIKIVSLSTRFPTVLARIYR